MQNLENVIDLEFDDFDNNALLYEKEITNYNGELEDLSLANESEERLYNYWVSIDVEKYMDKLNTNGRTVR
jgi:hypothetical protein